MTKNQNIDNIIRLYNKNCDIEALVLQHYSGAKAPHTKSRVDRFSKGGVDSVQKSHAITDIVECKNSTRVVQVDADPVRRWGRKLCAPVVVHERVLVVGAVQTPGLVIPAQAAVVPAPFAADSLVGDGHVDLRPPPVQLPVAASPRHTLSTQHLEHRVCITSNEKFQPKKE